MIEKSQICNYALQSSGRPYAITAHSDLQMISKNRELAQVVVQVVDEKGVLVMISEDEVTYNIEGPATLLGLEASNNSDMGDITDNVQHVYHGRLLAYVQSTGKTGTLTLTFTAPWLKETKVTINVTE